MRLSPAPDKRETRAGIGRRAWRIRSQLQRWFSSRRGAVLLRPYLRARQDRAPTTENRRARPAFAKATAHRQDRAPTMQPNGKRRPPVSKAILVLEGGALPPPMSPEALTASRAKASAKAGAAPSNRASPPVPQTVPAGAFAACRKSRLEACATTGKPPESVPIQSCAQAPEKGGELPVEIRNRARLLRAETRGP